MILMTSYIWSSTSPGILGKALPSPFENFLNIKHSWNFTAYLVSYQAEFLQKCFIAFDHFDDYIPFWSVK